MNVHGKATDLAYLALVVDEPVATAARFEKDFGLPRSSFHCGGSTIPLISVGATALALFGRGDPFLGPNPQKGLHHMALGAADPEAAARACGLPLAGETASGLDGRAQVALAPAATCGVRVRFTEPLGLPPARSDLVERIDHVGVASVDNRVARETFIEKLGCVYESEQTDSEVETISENFTSDTHQYIFHTRPSRLSGSMRVTFITVGDCELEFLQDLTTSVGVDAARHDAAGDTRADRSAIARHIVTRGVGLHHIALKTPDVDAALGRLGHAGYRRIDTTGRPGSRRARIGFLHPAALGGVLVHLVEREAL